ncbi:unnamed protein product [Periconia digitata]|uniref:AB hydrolase-1 domain-containing protein n=1 Tax=Periconia digitata TaxID=1303443 RepID=A0A9W4UP04_9PLEO|nr:unnamed protein product [Periconia digitata]
MSPNFDLDPPSGGYPQGEEDTQAVLAVLKLLIENQNRRVLLVAHSGGGFAATQSAIPELQEKHRRSRGLTGGLFGIFYYGAFIVPLGESLHTTLQPKDGQIVTPPWLQFHKNERAGIGTVFEPEKYLFNGLDEGQIKKWKPLLTGSPMCMTKLTNNAYETLPCAYPYLENDRMLPKAVQEQLVAAQSEKTGAFKVYNCASGHSPHLSHTQELVDKVLDFANGLVS